MQNRPSMDGPTAATAGAAAAGSSEGEEEQTAATAAWCRGRGETGRVEVVGRGVGESPVVVVVVAAA